MDHLILLSYIHSSEIFCWLLRTSWLNQELQWQVIEIGKGSKVKYELDKASGLIKVWIPVFLLIEFPDLSIPIFRFFHSMHNSIKGFLLGQLYCLHYFQLLGFCQLYYSMSPKSCILEKIFFNCNKSTFFRNSHGRMPRLSIASLLALLSRSERGHVHLKDR